MECLSHISMCIKGAEPTYKVVRVYRNTARRDVLKRNLSLDYAQSLVRSYPNKKLSMVIYIKQ